MLSGQTFNPMEQSQLVTVLIPMKNGTLYIKSCLNSLKRQTYENLEILIVNDHSTDDSTNIIRSSRDKRIILLHSPSQGIVPALNYGLSKSKGKYIARLDTDDLALPSRIEEQVNYLETHPHVGVIGSWVRGFGSQKGIFRYPASSKNIKCELLFSSPFAHPSVLLRKSVLTKNKVRYDSSYPHVEDYAFWFKLQKYTDFYNLPKVLTLHRFHHAQVGEIHHPAQSRARYRLQHDILRDLSISHPDMDAHSILSDSSVKISSQQLHAITEWINLLIKANKSSKKYGQIAMQISLGRRYLEMIFKLPKINILQKIQLLSRPYILIAVVDILIKKISNLL